MIQVEKTSAFQKAIEAVDVYKRLQEQRRNKLLQAVAEAREEYFKGNVLGGSVADLLAELDNWYDEDIEP